MTQICQVLLLSRKPLAPFGTVRKTPDCSRNVLSLEVWKPIGSAHRWPVCKPQPCFYRLVCPLDPLPHAQQS